jgi:hypothetical protein
MALDPASMPRMNLSRVHGVPRLRFVYADVIAGRFIGFGVTIYEMDRNSWVQLLGFILCFWVSGRISFQRVLIWVMGLRGTRDERQ